MAPLRQIRADAEAHARALQDTLEKLRDDAEAKVASMREELYAPVKAAIDEAAKVEGGLNAVSDMSSDARVAKAKEEFEAKLQEIRRPFDETRETVERELEACRKAVADAKAKIEAQLGALSPMRDPRVASIQGGVTEAIRSTRAGTAARRLWRRMQPQDRRRVLHGLDLHKRVVAFLSEVLEEDPDKGHQDAPAGGDVESVGEGGGPATKASKVAPMPQSPPPVRVVPVDDDGRLSPV